MTKRLSQLRIRLNHCGKIARDESGNIMWITALALVPLIGLVGSGVDMSRYYAAQTRLQKACDAGIMAARKKMITTPNAYTTTLDSSVEEAGDNMFDFNYPANAYGSTAKSFTVSVPAGTPQNTTPQRLSATATSTVPPLIMGMFNFLPQQLSITCGAQLEISNVDAVLVLDVTGSMACPSNDTGAECDTWISRQDDNADGGYTETTEAVGSRMQALRNAVMSFYDNIAGVQSADTRIRIGIVPYSSHVNIGNFTKSGTSITGGTVPQYMDSSYFADSWSYYSSTGTSTNRNNLRNFITNRSNTINNKVWTGCIEEVATKAVSDPATSSSLSQMLDMNVNYIPSGNTDANLFKPSVESSDNSAIVHCPSKESSELTRFTSSSADRTAMSNYVTALKPRGGTYHDVGMIWGIRLIAPNGMFASLNNETPGNGLPVGKHIIFMTDGQMSASPWAKSAYGIDVFDKRIASNGYTFSYDRFGNRTYALTANRNIATPRHRKRFDYLCSRAKAANGGNATVWVVSFGVDLNDSSADATSLRNCATTTNHAFSAANAEELNSAFAEIASRISKLRLSQ